jgi:hypothetical protein
MLSKAAELLYHSASSQKNDHDYRCVKSVGTITPNFGGASPPVDTPLHHRFVNSTHSDITQRYEKILLKILGCKPTRFQLMAMLLIRSDRSERITKKANIFCWPLDHRIKKLIGHESTHVDP